MAYKTVRCHSRFLKLKGLEIVRIYIVNSSFGALDSSFALVLTHDCLAMPFYIAACIRVNHFLYTLYTICLQIFQIRRSAYVS